MDSEKPIRSFLALPLAAYFAGEISPVLRHLKKQYPKIRWVAPEGIHVTLHFFGAVTSEEVSRISAIIRDKTQGQREIEVYLEGIGAFPTPSRPRVIWMGLKGEVGKLQQLQKSQEEAFKNAGFLCEERAFKPHLTLGRLKQGSVILKIEQTHFPATTSKRIKELILYRSRLTPRGAEYDVLETFPFAST